MSSQVTVTRYYGPEGPEEVWRVVSEALGWVAYGPAGEALAPQPSLVEALEISGACRFEKDVSLRVGTEGVLLPFRPGDAWASSEAGPEHETLFSILPVFSGWWSAPHDCCPDDCDHAADLRLGSHPPASETSFDPDSPAHPPPSCANSSFHPEMREYALVLDEAYGELGYCVERLIVVDGFLVAVSEDTGFSAFVVHDPEWHRPLFFDLWLHLSVANGYGTAEHFVGEISPGVFAEFSEVDSSIAFSMKELQAGQAERSFQAVLAALEEQELYYEDDYDGCRLVIQGDEVVLVDEDGAVVEWPDVEGRIGPTPKMHSGDKAAGDGLGCARAESSLCRDPAHGKTRSTGPPFPGPR